ncbi:protein ANKUB1-like isoform X2 [Melanotaenia boesemani]|uniref:protein ANKUB1-like isoform X2 n=1 Tax=Melanotaenia boesemani TaxID=1250792 RepID=UPI001C03ACA2|nr:protein ANKUB1-like isoform X2 [Melanotaenia boesemani]
MHGRQMRIFICYEGFCEHFYVSPDETVDNLKQMVKDNFLVKLSQNELVRQYLELNYGGVALQDSWALCDVGITRGSTIRCLIKSETRPVMHVFNTVTGETVPIVGNECGLHVSVAKLKTMVSVQSNLPVSAFSLSTPARVQLYDCNWLKDYGIKMGAVFLLDTWDGWVEFLQGCLQGNRLTVQSHLSEEEAVIGFQLQVALYIAASLGHLDLATWLLGMGVPAEEPVGVHPYRQWCQQSAHQDANKCPIHVAAENNQLLILKLFITKNLFNLARRDPAGRDLLKIAIEHGHRQCACYLANKLFSVVSVFDISLPMRIYLQMKRWVSLGKKKRAASSQYQYTGAAFKARLGNKILVDGFNQRGLSSKSKEVGTKSRYGLKAKALPPLPPISKLQSKSYLPSERTTHALPSMQLEKELQKIQCMRRIESGLLDQIKDGNSKLYQGEIVHPSLLRENIPRPFAVTSVKSLHNLKSSYHWGQTRRENAACCLAIASTAPSQRNLG